MKQEEGYLEKDYCKGKPPVRLADEPVNMIIIQEASFVGDREIGSPLASYCRGCV